MPVLELVLSRPRPPTRLEKRARAAFGAET